MRKSHLYHLFIEPRSDDVNSRTQEAVLNWLLLGSLVLTAVALFNTLFSFLILRDSYLPLRLGLIGGLLVLFAGLLALSRQRQERIVPAVVLLLMLFAAATAVAYRWDIIDPVGVLLFSLVITMAGILLSARAALYAMLVSVITLSLLEYAKSHHYFRPRLAWEQRPSSFTDVASFAAIYAVLALVSWLFNRQMERALSRANRSERALKHQRDLLEVKVAERTRALQAAQLEQLQHVYRFAELGHLSTALFHDLANHVMSVSIDVEGLQKRGRSDIVARIGDNVRHIDEVVKRVQRQIGGQSNIERFNVRHEIQEVMHMLAYFSDQQQVRLELTAPRQLTYHGDVTRFRQIIMNLLSNAIEAYRPARRGADNRLVKISLAKTRRRLIVTVTDRGRGIKPAAQTGIFEPFYTTKDKGMGIGLFIVKRAVEQDFHGTISVASDGRTGTTFSVNLPAGTS